MDRVLSKGKLDLLVAIEDFCRSLFNDGMDLLDRDEWTSISLDLILSMLGGNDDGKIGKCELSMEDGSFVVNSGILWWKTMRKSLSIYNPFSCFMIFTYI